MLNDQGASSNNWALRLGCVLDDDDVVGSRGNHLVILLRKVAFLEIANGSQDSQAIEKATVVVGLSEGS